MLIFKLNKQQHMVLISYKLNSRFCQYLKLFIGLGLIWSLEIIGGVLSQDSINETAWYVKYKIKSKEIDLSNSVVKFS